MILVWFRLILYTNLAQLGIADVNVELLLCCAFVELRLQSDPVTTTHNPGLGLLVLHCLIVIPSPLSLLDTCGSHLQTMQLQVTHMMHIKSWTPAGVWQICS